MNMPTKPVTDQAKHRTRGQRFASGFTLIEVLVVVAILALLVAVLLPALGRARAQARLSSCGSHLRQIGVAMNLFATEHKGRVPRGMSRHGGTTLAEAPNWVRMVSRMFGDRANYAANFNRVRVERYEVFSCPERAREYSGVFLDFVVNSTDHRGPMDLNSCQPNPTGGSWYEVEGVSKLDVWKQPSETIYAMDAIEESWNVHDINNSWGTMKDIRLNIAAIRQPSPPSQTGFDWFDVAGGRNFPTYQDFVGNDRFPRASLKMHLGRGSNAVFVDGHVDMVRPPDRAAGKQAVHEFYMRKLGVDRKIIPGSTAITTTAMIHPCTVGDTDWRP